MPVMIWRSGNRPCRTMRWRPSSVTLAACSARKSATSASTACASKARAPLRKISVRRSVNGPGGTSLETLVSVTAYRSFGGEVEARITPMIRRLIRSTRHQLPAITHHLVRTQCRGPSKAERLGGPEIDYQLELCGLLNREVGGLGPLQDLIHEGGSAPE